MKMFSPLAPTNCPLLLLTLIHTIAINDELFSKPSSTLYFVVKAGAHAIFSLTVLPIAIGMIIEMTNFKSNAAAASYMADEFSESALPLSGAELNTAFRMKGTVNTPNTFVVTVSIKASAPLPSALVTSVTPDVKVVGTHENSASPYRN